METATDLYLFREIAAQGSFVAAAEKLKLTPSAVSKRLSRFEARLQVRLFNRTTRSLALTEAGRELLQRTEVILDAIDEAEQQARSLSETAAGRIRVACSDAFALHVIVPLLPQLYEAHPGLSVILVQGDGPLDLVAEKVDLAIRFEPPALTSFVAKRLIDDPWVVCASPSYLERYGHPQSPADLHQHRCLTIEARMFETNRWTFANEELQVASVFSGIGLVVREAALAGLGVARLAQFLVIDDLREGRLVELLASSMPESDRAIYAVYPNREYLAKKVRVFIDALAESLGADLLGSDPN